MIQSVKYLYFALGFFFGFLGSTTAHANELWMPSIFGDNMVLQEQVEVTLWGEATPDAKVLVQASWNNTAKSTVANSQGKWKVNLDTPEASFTPHTVEVKSSGKTIRFEQVLLGQVWICSGQSNMQFSLRSAESGPAEIKNATFPNIRLYNGGRVHSPTPLKDTEGSWQSCRPDTAAKFSAVGYFFGKELFKKINKPIGLICLSWGGTPVESWMRPGTMGKFNKCSEYLEQYWKVRKANYAKATKRYEEKMKKWQSALKQDANAPRPKKPRTRLQNQPHHCYNGMIAPIMGYSIAGVIWYQGEANTPHGRYPYYQDQFVALISDWRKTWGQGDFPFLFVQLAASTGYGVGVSHVRQAQMLTLKQVPNTGMAVTMDIGDASDHHPKNKRDVGYRLSLWALKNKYGQKDIVPSGPIYKSKKIEGNKIRLYFDYADNGLIAKGGELTDFAVCGSDHKFYPAKTVIDGNTVLAWSEKVSHPQHASFAWCEYAEPNFYNKEELPASPFTTILDHSLSQQENIHKPQAKSKIEQ